MLHRYTAARARPLAVRLAEVLAEPPADPMTPEWLATPSPGMHRWVLLELAARLGASNPNRVDGVASNIVRAAPGALRQAILDGDRRADEGPWTTPRLAWSVLEVLADPQESDLNVPSASGAPRYGTARRVADLFDRYHLHRPSMVRSWAAGRSVNGLGRPLPEDQAWQPDLWRRVRVRIGEASPPERWPGLLAELRADTVDLDLPDRLVFFGFSRLPGGDFFEMVEAVAIRRGVHLFFLQPAELEGGDLLSAAAAPIGGLRPRADDLAAERVDHPLLRSWGRSQRETAMLLADAEALGLPPAQAIGRDTKPPPTTLLGRLQWEIGHDRLPAGTLVPVPTDRSVQFHACYGPTRQVEVLRDAILHLLADDSSLREDDIVVLCPDLSRFAPILQTVLGRSAPPDIRPGGGEVTPASDAPTLRYQVVDRSLKTANPVGEATLSLLALVSGRFEVTALLDFLALGPVRAGCGLGEDDLATIARWAGATQVRWGLDPAQRSHFGLPPAITANSWRAALDRLLVGSTVNADELAVAMGPVAPYGIGGDGVDCLGRLAQAVCRLGELVAALSSPRPVAEWVALVGRAVLGLLGAPPEESWQLEAVEESLADALAVVGGTSPSPLLLDWTDARRLLEEMLAPRLGRTDFFRGGVTVTSLVPLRWVPFRVVCLLGMDQPSLTTSGASGDDLVATAPVVGDRDPRADLRAELLEAVLAAGDHLVVLRDGNDPRNNQSIPQAVATAELFEAVLATVIPESRPDVARRLEIDHPCHPFDERCFVAGGLIDGQPWGYEREDLAGAAARRQRRPSQGPFLGEPLAPHDVEVIELADLRSFFADPITYFLRERLGVRLIRDEDRMVDTLPVGEEYLEQSQMGNRLIDYLLTGHTVDEWRAYEEIAGGLPAGALGAKVADGISGEAAQIVQEALRLGVESGPATELSVDVLAPDGTRIVGAVPLRLQAARPGPALVTYTRERSSHLVRAWVDLMALTVGAADQQWRSVVISRRAKGKGSRTYDFTVAQPGRDVLEPADCLQLAVDYFRAGMVEPLPMFPKLSYSLYRNGDGNLSDDWRPQGPAEGWGDGDRTATRLVFGHRPLKEILELPSRPGDPGAGTRRVQRLAVGLYQSVDRSMHRPPAAPTSATGRSRSRRSSTPGGRSS